MPEREPESLDSRSEGEKTSRAPRPCIGILFECCGVYARVYRQPWEPMYVGRCPKCLRTVRVRVGTEGTNARLFRAR